jgi:hypothetical protein
MNIFEIYIRNISTIVNFSKYQNDQIDNKGISNNKFIHSQITTIKWKITLKVNYEFKWYRIKDRTMNIFHIQFKY